jgi:[protein-PII] uridylyltransferase
MQPVCESYFGPTSVAAAPRDLSQTVREYLAAARQYLLAKRDAGTLASEINAEHAELTDRLLRALFRVTEDRYFLDFPRLDFRIAIVAVGGYGRSELSLASDIDLLFLHPGKLNPYVETIAESMTHRLWDARLTVGAATRTIAECMRMGREDLTTMTSYMDMRFLAGAPELFADLGQAVKAYMRVHYDEFVQGKLEEQRARHERFGDSLYLLQPNVRESVGGLRDYHTARWVARAVQWDVRSLRDLHVHGFIDDTEHAEMQGALEFIWRVRNELHRGFRRDDRLHYHAQERLAKWLGYSGTETTLAVEDLMRAYYVHARAIELSSRRVVEHTQAIIERRNGAASPPPRAVAEGFVIADRRIEIPHADLLQQRPARLLAVFAIAQHHDVDLSPRAQRLIRQNLDLITPAFRRDEEAAALFRQILSSPLRVYRSLRQMSELGVLGAYIPEFADLVGLWQQDMYHTYTVDVHSLFLVEQLRRIQRGHYRKELPLATALMREIRSPVVLYLSCVLHDIGKGKGGGHSEKGARMIPRIARRLHLSDAEIAEVQFLVRHHLTMNAIAERRNVHEHRVIVRLAELGETRERLRNLYLITVADIRSVSPEAWNQWKASLLDTFYRNAAQWLEADDAESQDRLVQQRAERAERCRAEALALLETWGRSVDRAGAFLDTMPPRYLVVSYPDEMASQLVAAIEFLDASAPLGVFIYRPSREDAAYWGLVVIARDRPGLFSTTTAVMSGLGHNVLSAEIYTTREGLAFDLFQLSPVAGGGPQEEELERERIEQVLGEVLYRGGKIRKISRIGRSPAASPTVRPRRPRMRISNADSDFYTIIDVAADDRTGLLADVTRALTKQNLDIGMSRVATRAQRVTDVFYVTEDGQRITDPTRWRAIRRAVLRAIESKPS